MTAFRTVIAAIIEKNVRKKNVMETAKFAMTWAATMAKRLIRAKVSKSGPVSGASRSWIRSNDLRRLSSRCQVRNHDHPSQKAFSKGNNSQKITTAKAIESLT